MNFDFTPFVYLLSLLAASVLGLLGYRALLAHHEDETLHLANPNEIRRQAAIAHKLELVDHWGKLLTVVACVYLLLLIAAYSYRFWLVASSAT